MLCKFTMKHNKAGGTLYILASSIIAISSDIDKNAVGCVLYCEDPLNVITVKEPLEEAVAQWFMILTDTGEEEEDEDGAEEAQEGDTGETEE